METNMEPQINREIFLEEWLETKKAFTEYMDTQKSLLDTIQLTKEDLGVIYKNAYNAFKVEDYAQAENLFFSLFIWDFKNFDFQIGLAAAYEAQEKFENAVSMYSLAMVTKDHDPEILFRLGKCLLAMGEKDEARILFELASEQDMTGEKNNLARLVSIEKSNNILELIKD